MSKAIYEVLLEDYVKKLNAPNKVSAALSGQHYDEGFAEYFFKTFKNQSIEQYKEGKKEYSVAVFQRIPSKGQTAPFETRKELFSCCRIIESNIPHDDTKEMQETFKLLFEHTPELKEFHQKFLKVTYNTAMKHKPAIQD